MGFFTSFVSLLVDLASYYTHSYCWALRSTYQIHVLSPRHISCVCVLLLIIYLLFQLMYVKFISNSKFVSVQTLPAITFMRRSLTEMFALDPSVSYQHAFLYIRQLAIHLRNAITLNKKVFTWNLIYLLNHFTNTIYTVEGTWENSMFKKNTFL